MLPVLCRSKRLPTRRAAMVLAWLVVAERVTRWVPWALEGGLVWLVFGDVVVVVLELLLRLLCCLVTSAVSSCANSLIWRSFRIFVRSVLLHSKMKWPSESATVLLLQHGQPPAAILLPIWYLYGSRSFCWHTCRHVWNEPFRAVARWWKPAARFGCRPVRVRKAFADCRSPDVA